MKLSCQEQLLPGAGLELRGRLAGVPAATRFLARFL